MLLPHINVKLVYGELQKCIPGQKSEFREANLKGGMRDWQEPVERQTIFYEHQEITNFKLVKYRIKQCQESMKADIIYTTPMISIHSSIFLKLSHKNKI